MTYPKMPCAFLDRRQILALGALALSAKAQTNSESVETLALWPGLPPGAPEPLPPEQVSDRASAGMLQDRIASHVARPQLAVFRPERPNGAAFLIIPGGAFLRVALDKEGYETGSWLSARGVTAFVLRYRLPGDGWRNPAHVPLQDAQRAMRLIRARAGEFSISPARTGVIGFSAGGHVAAMLSVASDLPTYDALDAADHLPSKPAITGLVYPVISMGEFAHPGSRDALLGLNPSIALQRALSAELLVKPGAPPTILFHADDDTTVSLDNSLVMHAALRQASTPAELHLFAEGGHGFGLRLPKHLPASHWPELFTAFVARQGFW